MLAFIPQCYFITYLLLQLYTLILETRLKKIFSLLLLLTLSLFAEVQNTYISQELLDKKIPLVDVRTQGEWEETGLLKGAIPIVFFSERGEPLINDFLQKLNQKVDTRKPFAIICHVGSRTAVIASWLSKELGYNVINIQGGMEYATKGAKLPTYPYVKE
jgi:rhodanese-related sulfurtransferase